MLKINNFFFYKKLFNFSFYFLKILNNNINFINFFFYKKIIKLLFYLNNFIVFLPEFLNLNNNICLSF
jgi:hypothetical protein